MYISLLLLILYYISVRLCAVYSLTFFVIHHCLDVDVALLLSSLYISLVPC